MKNWKLVSVTAACLSALVFAAACTVEEGSPDGDAGAAGSSSTAGTGGTTATAGAGGEAGAAATPQTFADFFDVDDAGTDSECGTCLKTGCAAELTACGDVSTTGAGACKDAANCLADTYQEGDPNYDCAFEACGTAAATSANADQVNSIFTCVQEKCAEKCYVTAGFGSCQK